MDLRQSLEKKYTSIDDPILFFLKTVIMTLQFEITRSLLYPKYTVECYLSSHLSPVKNYIRCESSRNAQTIEFRFPCTQSCIDPIHACIGIVCYENIRPVFGSNIEGHLKLTDVDYTRKQVVGQQCLALRTMIQSGKLYTIDITDPTRSELRIVRETVTLRIVQCTGIRFDESPSTRIEYNRAWKEIMDIQLNSELLPMTQHEAEQLYSWRTSFLSFVRTEVTSSQYRYRNYHFQSWTCYPAYLPIWAYSLYPLRFSEDFVEKMVNFLVTKNKIKDMQGIVSRQKNSATLMTETIDLFVVFSELCCLVAYMCDYYPDISQQSPQVCSTEVEQVVPLMYGYMSDCDELGSHGVHVWYWFFSHTTCGSEDMRSMFWVANLFVGEVIEGAACDFKTSRDNKPCPVGGEERDENGPDTYMSHIYGCLMPRATFLSQCPYHITVIRNELYQKQPKYKFEDELVLPLIMEGTIKMFPFISPITFVTHDNKLAPIWIKWLTRNHDIMMHVNQKAITLEKKYSLIRTLNTYVSPFLVHTTELDEFSFSGFYRRASEMWTPLFAHFDIPLGHFEVCNRSDDRHAVKMNEFIHGTANIVYKSCLTMEKKDLELLRTLVAQQYPDPVFHDSTNQREADVEWKLHHENNVTWNLLKTLALRYPMKTSDAPIIYYVNHLEKLKYAINDIQTALSTKDINGIEYHLFVLTLETYYIEIQCQ